MGKQAKLTRLGKEIIPVQLVGQNINYEVLKEPRTAYPKGDEFRYSDDYLARLNNTYSLSDILGEKIEAIAEGGMDALAQVVMDSPLRNSEGEDVLGYMLINSVKAGLWQPYIVNVPSLMDAQIRTAREYLERVETISPTYNQGKVYAGVLFGLSVAKRGGLALPVEHENKVIAVPSQEFVEYCETRKCL